MSRFLIPALVLAAAVPPARADVKPHPLFTEHMVLQRDVPLPVWGKADPGEKVTVTLAGGDGKSDVVEVAAGDKGMWTAMLPKRSAGTGFTLTIKGNNTVALKDVLVGDVWLCSGQSNMEWLLRQLPKEDQGKKVAAAAADPQLRLFDVPNRPFPAPQADFPQSGNSGRWLECKPETVINFSAVGYFFGREIRKSQNVPVGLIASDWGGTPAEAWTSITGLRSSPEIVHYADAVTKRIEGYNPAAAEAKYKADLDNWKKAAEKAKADGKQPPRQPAKPAVVDQNQPTALYNGMIAPLLPFPIRGAIWYQGESNAGRAAEYRTLFPAMIADWRKQWGYEFPFLLVQLAPFQGGRSGVDYAELRDAQTHATKALPKVGIAVITDAGDETDIHPQRKEPAGVRLALAARAISYGEAVEYQGPTYKSHAVEGDKVAVTFDHANGLTAKGGEVHGFAVCGEDKKFHPATAEIKGNTVVVRSAEVSKPVAVRFGWANFAKPELNLFNAAGLPAVPFRTDDLPLTTAAKK